MWSLDIFRAVLFLTIFSKRGNRLFLRLSPLIRQITPLEVSNLLLNALANFSLSSLNLRKDLSEQKLEIDLKVLCTHHVY